MTSIKEAITDYRYAILHLAEGTQREYNRALLVFCAWCEGQKRDDGSGRLGLELEDLRPATMRRFVEALKSRPQPRHPDQVITPKTIHNYLTAIKIFFNWLAKEDGYEGVLSPRLRRIEMPKLEKKVMEVFTDEHIRRLFAACEEEYSPKLRVRDRAIVSVLLDTGIRASELVGLTLDNTFLDPLDGHLKVDGKSNKWREVPLGRKSLAILRRYTTRYRGRSEHQNTFLSRTDEPMTVFGLEQLVKRLGEWAKIPPTLCHPHTFRHTFAVRFLEETGDIYRLSRVMGHASVKITEIYVAATSNKSARTGVSVVDRVK